MGNIDFRTGHLTGKLGGLVGARWKQSPYTRRYVIPANPQTVDQMAVRDSWALLVLWLKRCNSTILKEFVLPKPKSMSCFNRAIQMNSVFIDQSLDVPSALVFSDGSLYALPITDIIASEATGIATFTWPVTKQGEALDTDIAILIVFNETRDTWGFATTDTRVDGTGTVVLAGAADDEAHGWMFFVQGKKLTSVTKYKAITYVA